MAGDQFKYVMATGLVALAVLAGVLGLSGDAWGAIGAQETSTAAPAPAREGEIQLVQAMPPQCAELMANKPQDLKAQLEWFKELRKCIEDNRDLIAPSLQVTAPDEVDARERSYVITGYVGDNGSVPSVFINGESVELLAPEVGAPDLGTNTFAFSYQVKVDPENGNDKFLIEATDANGNRAAEERLVVLAAANRPKFKGDFYALIIGNSEYDYLPPVKTAENDAKAVADILRRYYLFDEERIQVILNATRRDILSSLTKIKKSLGLNDRLLVFYSGHGYYDEVTGVGFWQATDADEIDDFSWVAIDSVVRNIAGMQAKHVLVIADSTFPVTTNRGSNAGGRDRLFETLDDFVSRQVIVSGGLSPEVTSISDENSVFTYFLLEVLRENKDPYMTTKQLAERLTRKVSAESDRLPELGTIADARDEGSGDFMLILRPVPLAPAE